MNKEECIQWCNNNKKELSRYFNQFLAVSLKKGVVVSEYDERKFISLLFQKFTIEEIRKDLFLTHSAAFGFKLPDPKL